MKGANARHPTPNTRPIRASEIAEYGYCSRAWWYKHVVKLLPPAGDSYSRLASGTHAHARHGRGMATASVLRVVGIGVAILALLVIVLALLGPVS